MNAKELKRAIKEEKLNNDFLVLLYQDNTYVADGYIDEICSTKGLEKRVVKSVYDSKNATNALLSNISENLYVVYTDTFSERSEDYSIFENVIVVCKKVEATVKEYISDMMVTLPKLSEWNIKDYISLVYCKGLKQQEVDWLYNVTQGNIYKMKSEVDKLKLFSPDQYTNILLQFNVVLFSQRFNYLVVLLICEALVFTIEYIVYKRRFKEFDHLKTLIYTIVANAVTLILTFLLHIV